MSGANRVAVLIIMLLVGCATRPDPPGVMIPVNGHAMHLYCSGPGAGLPTVVLEGANMGLSPFYRNLQDSLAQTLRVCSYDRAGIAWSEPGNGVRDAKTIAAELHVLLQAAGIEPPFILAGHSLGGLFALRYAASRYVVVPGSDHYTLVSTRSFAEEVGEQIVALARAAP